MIRLRSGPPPPNHLCAISASFKFYPIDSFRAVCYRTCRESLGATTDLEWNSQKRFRGRYDRARDIGDSEAALVYGVEVSVLQVLGHSEGSRTG